MSTTRINAGVLLAACSDAIKDINARRADARRELEDRYHARLAAWPWGFRWLITDPNGDLFDTYGVDMLGESTLTVACHHAALCRAALSQSSFATIDLSDAAAAHLISYFPK